MKSIKTSLAFLMTLAAWNSQAVAKVQCDTTPNSPIAKSIQIANTSLQEWSSEFNGAQLKQVSADGCTELASVPYTKIVICGAHNQTVEPQLVIESVTRILDQCTIRIATLYHASGSETLEDGITVRVRRF